MKNITKKLTKGVACFGLALSLVACSGSKIEDKALDQLEAVIQNITTMGSFNYEIGFDATQDTVKAQVKLSGGFKTEGGIEASSIVDLTSNGQTMEKFAELYFTDNAMFMQMLGQKQQTPIALDVLKDIPFDASAAAIDKEMMKEFLTSASVGGNTVSLEFNTDKINEANKENNASDSLSSLTQMQAQEISVFTVEMTTTDNLIDNMIMHIEGIVDEQKISVDLTFTFKDINKVDTISFPADLDSYPISEDSLL